MDGVPLNRGAKVGADGDGGGKRWGGGSHDFAVEGDGNGMKDIWARSAFFYTHVQICYPIF